MTTTAFHSESTFENLFQDSGVGVLYSEDLSILELITQKALIKSFHKSPISYKSVNSFVILVVKEDAFTDL